jgi:hypothetical protein
MDNSYNISTELTKALKITSTLCLQYSQYTNNENYMLPIINY